MKRNPTTLRWEGNDQVLRDFDTVVGTSTRPALITHLTGSSIGSPVGSFAAGALGSFAIERLRHSSTRVASDIDGRSRCARELLRRSEQ
jgi:hypothetical protein